MIDPAAEQRAQIVYANLMEEAKERISGIAAALECRELSERLKSDFCVLQFRFICESLALACLAAHGDYTGAHTAHLRREWRANEIMRRLADLNPNFFPRAMIQNLISEGNFHLDPRPGAMTKDEFLSLYGRCGEYLHIGNFSDLLADKTSSPLPMPEIVVWGRKFVELLSVHTILLLDETKVIGCVLRNSAANNQVTVFTALADLK
jgi:hypothetical protein